MLYNSLKTLHLIGLALFLGSVFGHVATSVLGGATLGSPEFLAARDNISALTRTLTLPGLGLALLSGLALAYIGRVNPLRSRWLAVHGALAAGIVALTALFVAPAGDRIATAIHSFGADAASASAIQSDLLSEHVFGSMNIAFAIIAIAVAIWKPRLARRSPANRPMVSTPDGATRGE